MRTIKGPAIKHPDDGAREGAGFVREHIIRVQERAFDASMQAEGTTAPATALSWD